MGEQPAGRPGAPDAAGQRPLGRGFGNGSHAHLPHQQRLTAAAAAGQAHQAEPVAAVQQRWDDVAVDDGRTVVVELECKYSER